MKRRSRFVISILGLLFAVGTIILSASCSKKPSPLEPAGILKKLATTRDGGEIISCYSKGTGRALDEAARASGVPGDKRHLLLPDFSGEDAWEIVKSAPALLLVRHTGKRAQNMQGMEIALRFVREDGFWKIDMEKEIRDSIRQYGKGNSGSYVQSLTTGRKGGSGAQ